jgi:radical SAM family uncharacterized protein
MELSSILKSVSKPGRYSGGEVGQTVKNKQDVKLRFAFCFPDIYEIGMSNLGMRILYDVLNHHDKIWCERVFAPWIDMEEKMREYSIPLTALESHDPVKEFDIVGFTMGYELCYTTVLNMLDLAGIPLRADERGEECPVILGGGACTYNAEPIADFFDLFSIGEGEEALIELSELYISMKENGTYTKQAFLREASHIEGFYVPSLYEVEYNDDGTLKSCTPKYDDVPARVRKRIIGDMDKASFPTDPIVPYIETVHDRITLEVYRGCIRGCRFCQAGVIYRPVREKSPELLSEQAKCLYENTGYDEISLLSLSISDYSKINELTDKLLEWTDEKQVGISLPSLRVDSFTKELMDKVSSVRTGGITFAPEAGTQRLRDAINKNVTEEDLLRAVSVAFAAGKTNVKLYFMQGLPTEEYEDIAGIAKLASDVVDAYYHTPERNRAQKPQVTISAACFIPKPFTPFQWEAQDSLEVLREKQQYLKLQITDRKIKYNYHDADVSRLEAVFARGNRRLGAVLEEAHRQGIKFDSWEECFDYNKWLGIFDKCGIDPAFYANRNYGKDELLPWEVIDCGVTREFLWRERCRAYDSKTTPSCREQCSGCGADCLGGEKTWCKNKKS